MRLTAAKPIESEPDPTEAFESGTPERAAIDYGPLNRRLGYVLRRAQIAVFRDFFAEFEAFDIRPGQYSILTVIESNPGLKQSAVSEALGIKRANFVAMIDELERRGLVRRDAAPNDRRSHALVLTPGGRRPRQEASRHRRPARPAVRRGPRRGRPPLPVRGSEEARQDRRDPGALSRPLGRRGTPARIRQM